MVTVQIAEVRIYMFNHVLISGGISNYIFRHHFIDSNWYYRCRMSKLNTPSADEVHSIL